MNQTNPKPTAVVLVNTGSPVSPTPGAVKAYLAEFLSDPHVIDLPGWLWQPILKHIILRTRPARSAAKYQHIWQPDGSPLIKCTQNLGRKLEQALIEIDNRKLTVHTAMLYGQSCIKSVLAGIRQSGVEHIVVLPLFPQYASATTASVLNAINQQPVPVTALAHYFDHPAYLQALTEQIMVFRRNHPPAEKLLFSFHSLPVKRIQNGDPYLDQCRFTAQQVVQNLNLTADTYAIAFQSRFGGGAWLQPGTKQTLKTWAKQGVQTVQVVSPGFAVDCLETCHEIEVELAADFQKAGGESLVYIPALNDTDLHVSALAEILQPYLEKDRIFRT